MPCWLLSRSSEARRCAGSSRANAISCRSRLARRFWARSSGGLFLLRGTTRCGSARDSIRISADCPLRLQIQVIVLFCALCSFGEDFEWSPAARILPASWNFETAVRARPLLQMVFQDVVPGSADQERLTLRAVRMCAIAVDISLVNVMESHRARDLAGAMQRFGRRARLVLQLEIGMKRREVQRHIGAEMIQDPLRQLARLRRIVVQRGDHQVRDLEPDVGLFFQPLESFEYGLKMRERDFP